MVEINNLWKFYSNPVFFRLSKVMSLIAIVYSLCLLGCENSNVVHMDSSKNSLKRLVESNKDMIQPHFQSEPEKMTQSQLHDIIKKYTDSPQINGNVLQCVYKQRPLYCISDVKHDRMRIISPIIHMDEILDEVKDTLLASNFHSALDARYATSEGVLYSAYIHPLSPLTAEQIESAVRQVASLAENFGTSYSSGELLYGQDGN